MGFIESLLATVLVYALFPLLFAELRKERITKKKYRRICFGGNFLVMLVFLVLRSFTGINGSTTGGPYLVWTPIMSSVGIARLKERDLLDESDEDANDASGKDVVDKETDNSNSLVSMNTALSRQSKTGGNELEETTTAGTEGDPQVKFCRICGKALPTGSKFCTACGTSVIGVRPEETPVRDTPQPRETRQEKKTLVLPTEDMNATLRRAFLFLEDAEWEKADSYLERVLDAEPENAYAYLGKTMLEQKAETLEQLAAGLQEEEPGKNYARVKRFAGPKLKQLLAALESWETDKGETI